MFSLHHTRRLLADLTVGTRLGMGFGALIALMLVLTLFGVYASLAFAVLPPSRALIAGFDLAAIAFIAWLIRQNTTIKNYIRESAGVKAEPGRASPLTGRCAPRTGRARRLG